MLPDIRQIEPPDFPPLLREIPDPPKELWVRGNTALLSNPITKFLTVVGSRTYTPYGKQALERLISGLAGYPIVIVSGLALGIDSLAHRAALTAGLPTIAVPGSGLNPDALYPRTNFSLAQAIIEQNGLLLSEYEPNQKAATWTFPKRNRIMAGLSHAVLVIEAKQKSGTLITARLATDYNRDVLTVPGSIFSEQSAGPHMLVRLGATPITSSEDILSALSIESKELGSDSVAREDLSEGECVVFEYLTTPLPRDELIRLLSLPTSEANALLSVMEIKGLVREELGVIRRQ